MIPVSAILFGVAFVQIPGQSPEITQPPRAAPRSGTATRLVDQRIDRGQRVCIYEAPDPEAETPARRRNRATADGPARPVQPRRRFAVTERCPPRDPGENSTAVKPIPSMAVFAGDEVRGNTRVCYYRYLGRVYGRYVAPTRTCPYTPHF